MYLLVEENSNCSSDERVFSESGKPREVAQVFVDNPAHEKIWCEVTGVDEKGIFSPARAVQVEDSGAGSAWLIYGGSWGVRLRPAGNQDEWSLENKHQWGVPFVVLDFSGEEIRFKL